MKDYRIEKDGKVFSLISNKYLSPYDNGLGYKCIKLVIDGKRKQFYVHRLVASEYIGDVNNFVVNHKDGNKFNNHINNLEICTQKDNQLHAFKNKLLKGFVSKYY